MFNVGVAPDLVYGKHNPGSRSDVGLASLGNLDVSCGEGANELLFFMRLNENDVAKWVMSCRNAKLLGRMLIALAENIEG